LSGNYPAPPVGKTRDQIIEMMSALNLPELKMMAEVVPANLRGGTG
jgi:hypothetical protein